MKIVAIWKVAILNSYLLWQFDNISKFLQFALRLNVSWTYNYFVLLTKLFDSTSILHPASWNIPRF